jgi:hypothetical protein
MLPTRRRENQKRRVDGSGDPGPAAGELPLPADSTRPTEVFAPVAIWREPSKAADLLKIPAKWLVHAAHLARATSAATS